MERTFVMVKPDGVERRLVGEMIPPVRESRPEVIGAPNA